jgi:hypothetical protein
MRILKSVSHACLMRPVGAGRRGQHLRGRPPTAMALPAAVRPSTPPCDMRTLQACGGQLDNASLIRYIVGPLEVAVSFADVFALAVVLAVHANTGHSLDAALHTPTTSAMTGATISKFLACRRRGAPATGRFECRTSERKLCSDRPRPNCLSLPAPLTNTSRAFVPLLERCSTLHRRSSVGA